MTEQEFVMDIIDEVLDCPMFQSAIAVNEAVKEFFFTEKAFNVNQLQNYYYTAMRKED